MADRIFGIMRYHLKPSSPYGCHYSNNYESYDFNRKRLGVFELTPSTLSRIARMKKSIKTLITLVAPFALVVSAHTAFAAGDVAKGEKDFKFGLDSGPPVRSCPADDIDRGLFSDSLFDQIPGLP